ncbi:MAG: rRNA maturation RNase YbeY [Cyanobacteria bacterium P01_D01_bin.56]
MTWPESTSLEVELWVETKATDALIQPSELPDKLTWQTWFTTWLQDLKATLSPIHQYEVSLLLTNDAQIQLLNSTYRHQDKSTDVLAFATQETAMPGREAIYQTVPLPLGDVIISVETAQRQRHDADYSLTQELAWLATHGLLHLLGWDHPDDSSLQKMLAQQLHLLRQVNLTEQ